MGIGQAVEGESHDRTDIDLPLVQHQLVAAIRAAYPHTPTAMFLLNGGMVGIAQEKESVPAILEAFYPGFKGGLAIADTLFGDNEHLGGRLPFTWYPIDYIHDVKMSDMAMRPHGTSPGRSYKYYTKQPTFPFGWGLSLTTFNVSEGDSSRAARDTEAGAAGPEVWQCGADGAGRTYTVRVENTGAVAGDSVIMAFFRPKQLQGGMRSDVLRQLMDFQRVHLQPGQSTTLSFPVAPASLSVVDPEHGDRLSAPGLYELQLTDGVVDGLRYEVQLQGAPVVLERFHGH